MADFLNEKRGLDKITTFVYYGEDMKAEINCAANKEMNYDSILTVESMHAKDDIKNALITDPSVA